jgi:hypothetical protein
VCIFLRQWVLTSTMAVQWDYSLHSVRTDNEREVTLRYTGESDFHTAGAVYAIGKYLDRVLRCKHTRPVRFLEVNTTTTCFMFRLPKTLTRAKERAVVLRLICMLDCLMHDTP